MVAGVLYLAGGVLFADRVQYGLGAWMLAVGAGSVEAGWPANFAVLALEEYAAALRTLLASASQDPDHHDQEDAAP